ncbi:MAG: thiol reductase thioredoxin [Phycisphaerae bacterium]|nr:thiol reductase thioredoxin [Phycisphaerae bacterium]|tara:strand:- start:698 stop:1270 length:573 start_codon:yes stop_codon:yes gene_type:complete
MRGLRSHDLQTVFQSASDWEGYLASDPEKAAPWRTLLQDIQLSDEQIQLLNGFTRTMRVLMISGIWCGDCVRQGPALEAIARANPCIDLRFIDRDAIPEVMSRLSINGGQRVPMVVFMAEDMEPVSVAGDRTLNYYRHMINSKLGISCPMPGAATDDGMIRLMTQDWIDEFERVHLLLRLSGRLRQIHGD